MDEVLISRVAGDGRTPLGLHDRYSGLVYGTRVRYLGDRTLAEDLARNVFLSVWRNAPKLEYECQRAGATLEEFPEEPRLSSARVVPGNLEEDFSCRPQEERQT